MTGFPLEKTLYELGVTAILKFVRHLLILNLY